MRAATLVSSLLACAAAKGQREPEGQIGSLHWGTNQLYGRYTFSDGVDAEGQEVEMRANPTSINIGDTVTMTWKDAGGYSPKDNDWFGWYCGANVSQVADDAFVAWEYVTKDSKWASGGGKYDVALSPSTNSQCEFRLFNHEDGSSYYKIGASNVVQVTGGLPPSKVEVDMTASPASISSGDKVTLAWKDAGSYKPQKNDWIGYYCGSDLSKVVDTGYLDWVYVTVDSQWATGAGSETVALQSGRARYCEFRLFNHEDGSSYYKIGTSNAVEITDAGSVAQQLHLALTGDVTEMLLHWTSGVNGGVVQYGPKGSAWEKSASATGTCHTYAAKDMCHAPATTDANFVDPGQLCEAVMTGLTPDAEYQYRVSVDGGKTYSSPAVFRAAPDADPEYNFSYIVYGDMGTWGGDSSTVTANLATKEIENGARMTHHFGDLSYARGYANIWDTWMSMIEPYAKVAPYMVGIGNHEFDYTTGGQNDPSGEPHFKPSWFNVGTDSGGECGVPTVNRFHMPGERSGGNGLWWHSYDFGSLHTIMLSSEHDVGEGSNQYTWLKKDLAAVNRSRTPWVVVELHRPMYNSEKYAGDYTVAENFQRLFEDLLVQYDVDLVLAGHYHSYLRTDRIYKDKADQEKGIYHFTIGSAGCSIDGAGLYDKDWNLFFDEDYGYGRITIANSTAMHWEYVRNKDNHDEMTVVDETWIIKRPAAKIYV